MSDSQLEVKHADGDGEMREEDGEGAKVCLKMQEEQENGMEFPNASASVRRKVSRHELRAKA